jgi:hypothetical protein
MLSGTTTPLQLVTTSSAITLSSCLPPVDPIRRSLPGLPSMLRSSLTLQDNTASRLSAVTTVEILSSPCKLALIFATTVDASKTFVFCQALKILSELPGLANLLNTSLTTSSRTRTVMLPPLRVQILLTLTSTKSRTPDATLATSSRFAAKTNATLMEELHQLLSRLPLRIAASTLETLTSLPLS